MKRLEGSHSLGRGRLLRRWWVATFWLLSGPMLMAHGDLHEQIGEVSQQILKDPAQGDLYFRRAELHRSHGSLEAAHADYDMAAKLAPKLAGLDLGRGQTFLAAGKYGDALKVLDRFLEANPRHVPAHVSRAKAWSLAKDFLAAAEDYTHAIQCSSQPEPEHYLDRSHALAAAGPEHFPQALQGIGEGLERLGEVHTLEMRAMELEISLKRYNEALGRVERLRRKAGRQEFWLERQGDILQMAGRPGEAQTAYHAALEQTRTRAARIRGAKSTQELENRLALKLRPDSGSNTRREGR